MNSRISDWLVGSDGRSAGSTTTSFTSKRRTVESTPISAVQLTMRAGEIVTRTETLNRGAHLNHAESIQHELHVRAQQHAKTAPATLLADIGAMGFAWRDVAQVLHVSVPALQKWRRGEGLSGDNRLALARFVAGIDIVAAQLVDDIASWFETPLTQKAPVTPLDLWADSDEILVLRFASNRVTGEQALDESDPDWRARWQSDFVPSRGEDGHISISREG